MSQTETNPSNCALAGQSDDETLVRRYVDYGDDACFLALHERYAGKVYRRCLSYCRNESDAEELTQEVFVKVFLSLARFRGDSSFSTWVYRIATNHCLNFLRARKEFLPLEEGWERKHTASPRESVATGFREALERLPRAVQALLLFKFRDGYTYTEISRSTGLTESAVKMRISRARQELKRWKEHEGG